MHRPIKSHSDNRFFIFTTQHISRLLSGGIRLSFDRFVVIYLISILILENVVFDKMQLLCYYSVLFLNSIGFSTIPLSWAHHP